jgi:hypothetical protein
MKKSDYNLVLEEMILLKEAELELEGRLLKIHFQQAYESLKPLNIIKSTFIKVISQPSFKTSIVDNLVGYASGFAAKKIISGNSKNPITKLLGTIIELAVTSKVTNNAEEIKSVAKNIINSILNKNNSAAK